MKLRVLVVDDSRFYRNRVVEMVSADPGLQVVDTAENGRDAVQKVREKRPDVITMDIEMPVLDGIAAVREIMKIQPTPILMFSTLTTEGARATLDALEAGALDFLPKRFADISREKAEVANELCRRLKALGRKRFSSVVAPRPVKPAAPLSATTAARDALKSYKLLAIGASTGGPAALQTILTGLPADFPLPTVVVQHMPAAFTGPFAARLDTLCKVDVKEARHGDGCVPGTVLIAPGGKQLEFERAGAGLRVKLRDSLAGEQYKPSVDISFNSAADVFGAGVLAVVLTGMGMDGKAGAVRLKQRGATVWAQDEASCVVYGMPHAIIEAGLADRILSLGDIAATLARGS